MPTCSGCCSEKPAADFLARRRRCRACRNALYKRWLYTNPSALAGLRMRQRLCHALHRTMSLAVMAAVGCDRATLLAHIESQWKPGQTWATYGKGPACWCLDHVRPLSAWADLTDPVQLCQAFHYRNVQPLWTSENCQKGNRLPRETGNGQLHTFARTGDAFVDRSGVGGTVVSA